MQHNLTDFYPTPKPLIRKLLAGLSMRECSAFLEPSGGRGDICDFIKAQNAERFHYSRQDASIDVIEINPELQHVIKGKGYRLIHDDFLTFETRKAYDCIVANFPFSEGDRHLDKALQLLDQYGGELRCLVNAETLKNPYTNLRRSLVTRLAALNADIEYLTGEFESAERRTSVEVALIKVTVERREPVSLILDSLKKAQAVEMEDAAPTGIIETDFVASIVTRFNVECDAGIKLIGEFYAMVPYIKDSLAKPGDSTEHDYSKPLLKLEVEGRGAGTGINADVNNYLRGVRSKYWEALVHDPRFTSQYTSNILKELSAKLAELKDYDFSVFNIREMQKDLSAKVIQGVEDAILTLFDKCSRQHAYGQDFGDNIHYYNGWKTNKAHKINKKIILPMYGLRQSYSQRGGQQIEYGTSDELQDMVKVFNYLSRDKVDVRQLVSGSVVGANNSQDFKLDLRYFTIKLFKKGTCHIWFNDLDLLDKFNIFGGQRKNWLPPAYGRKAYAEMSEEERQTVDGFQGRARYDQVMRELEFYIVDTRTLLLAE